MVRDTVVSLARHGFTRFFFVNGHGGNIATVTAAFSEIYSERSMEKMSNQPSIKCALRNWWDGPGIKRLSQELYPVGEGSHATASEVALTWYKYPETIQRKEMDPEDRAERIFCRRRGLSAHLPGRPHRLRSQHGDAGARQALLRHCGRGSGARLRGLGRPVTAAGQRNRREASLDSTDPPLPETRFARVGEVSIAYQTMGKGSLDLIVMPGIVSHVEFFHEVPDYTRFLRRLASFARVVTFDKRGQGLSDRVPGVASLEERADDLEAVMAAIRSERAALLGFSEGASLSALYSATHPQRVSHLVLYGGFARYANASDFSLMYEPDVLRASAKHWGKGYSIKLFAPSLADDPATKQMWAKGERLCVSPGDYRTMIETNMKVDVRAVLPQIRVPTLVLHRATDLAVPVTNGRFLANAIPGAKYKEYPSGDHMPYAGTDFEPMCGDIEEFITGHRGTPADAERVLATVLFTDIVESTQLLTRMGDRAWRQLLDEHDRLGRRLVEQHRGRFVKSTGDGLLATFDGPARAIRCAQQLRSASAVLGIAIRAGLHTGEIEPRGGDVGGVAVHIASRVLGTAGPEEIVVSRVLPDLVAGSDLSFAPLEPRELKGFDGIWELFTVN